MKKLTDRQVEELVHAMDLIHDVKLEIEGKKNTKRIWKKLDDCLGALDNIIQNDRG